MPLGNYYAVEKSVPAPYKLDETHHTFSFTYNYQSAYLNIENVVDGDSGRVKIIKTDDSGNPLSGVVFGLYRSWDASKLGELTTGEDGTAESGELIPGDYHLLEQTGKPGFTPVTGQIAFTIDGSGATVELPIHELVQIVREYVDSNFVDQGFCAIAAIHEGRNEIDPTKNNPHVHIIVPTRSVGPAGFLKKKNREWNKNKFVRIWRERWAEVQNRAYERNSLDIKISHESLEVQGKSDREPTSHLSRIDWQKEICDEHTIAGDEKRAIKARNRERLRQRQLEQEQKLELELSR